MKPKPKYDSAEVEKIIEGIIRSKKRKHRFPGVSEDDIAQEIRKKIWESLHKFDESKGQSLAVFLGVCAERRLKNFKRDEYIRYIPPCTQYKCPLFDDHLKICRFGQDLTEDTLSERDYICKPYEEYMDRTKAKLYVRSPISFDVVQWGESGEPTIEAKHTNDFYETVHAKIKSHGAEEAKAFWALMQGRGAGIQNKMKQRVRSLVAEILEDMGQVPEGFASQWQVD